MRSFVTGGAGFIGSHLVDRLLVLDHEVLVYDNFSTGRPEFLESAKKNHRLRIIEGDLLDEKKLTESISGFDQVFHIAANADVRFGTNHPRQDLEQNTIGTFHVLEAMRKNGIRRIIFPSTGSVYGESEIFPTPEDAPFPVQTSLYGASKLAAEGLIEAYVEGFGFQAWMFRFVSILGARYTHGHVVDFYKRLIEDPDRLDVLGDGHQKKSYLHMDDCINAIMLAIEKTQDKLNIFNLGTDEYVEVNDSSRVILETLQLKPKINYSGTSRGWIGDNPFIFLETAKIQSLGWKPTLSIKEAIVKTVEWLSKNEWLLKRV